MRSGLLAVTCLLVVAGCGSAEAGRPVAATEPPPASTTSPPPTTSSAPPSSTAARTAAKPPPPKPAPRPVSGVVVLDPGHNGGNA
ncbi:MAG: N-acetylmuramoyl-L-alanine amidase, partial [Actinophytocola sp.]